MFQWRHIIVVLGVLSSSCVAATPLREGQSDIGRFVSKVATGPLSRERLETVFQTAFVKGPGTQNLRIFEVANLHYGHLRFERVSFKQPFADANFGPFVTANLIGSCLPRGAILAQYKTLAISDTPHGHSMSEETVFSRPYLGGELSFGFTEAAPDCLRSITFRRAK